MTLSAGFADPAQGAQACFRAVLDAMARPGTVQQAGVGLDPPPALDPATASVVLTLIDADTALWLDPVLAGSWPWIAFHTGARRADRLEDAAFVLAATLPDLASLSAGSDTMPENSATLILQLPAIGSGTALRLQGPGIEAEATLMAAGLPDDFAQIWSRNHALFPRGVDLLLASGVSIAALPRSAIAALPRSVIAALPRSVIAALPRGVIAALPRGVPSR